MDQRRQRALQLRQECLDLLQSNPDGVRQLIAENPDIESLFDEFFSSELGRPSLASIFERPRGIPVPKMQMYGAITETDSSEPTRVQQMIRCLKDLSEESPEEEVPDVPEEFRETIKKAAERTNKSEGVIRELYAKRRSRPDVLEVVDTKGPRGAVRHDSRKCDRMLAERKAKRAAAKKARPN